MPRRWDRGTGEMFADLVRAKPKLVGLAALGCIGIFALVGFVLLQMMRYWQESKLEASRVRRELISEFDKIHPLPGSEPQFGHKGSCSHAASACSWATDHCPDNRQSSITNRQLRKDARLTASQAVRYSSTP